MDGIAASNFIVQEDHGLALDAVTSERVKYLVRAVNGPCILLSGFTSSRMPHLKHNMPCSSGHIVPEFVWLLGTTFLPSNYVLKRLSLCFWPQASAKWRLMWRLAPRLLEQWSATGRLDAINAAVSTTTKKVCSPAS